MTSIQGTFDLLISCVATNNHSMAKYILQNSVSIINDLVQFGIRDNCFKTVPYILEKTKFSPIKVKQYLDEIPMTSDMTTVLKTYLDKNTSVPEPVAAPTPVAKRPVVVLERGLDMVPHTTYDAKSSKNSVLMLTLYNHPEQAHQELLSGVISKEELNYQNDIGWTVLHYTCRNTRLIPNGEKIVKTLLDLGANVNVQNKNGYTPLIHAFNWPDDSTENVRKLLLAHQDIDVNLKQCDSATAITLACEDKSKVESIKMLLKHPKIDVSDPRILKHLIQRKSDKDVINLIVEILMHPTNKSALKINNAGLKKMAVPEVATLLTSSDFEIVN